MKTEIEILRGLHEKYQEVVEHFDKAWFLPEYESRFYPHKIMTEIASLEKQLEKSSAEEGYYEKYNLCNSCSQSYCKDRRDGKTGRVTDCTRFKQ